MPDPERPSSDRPPWTRGLLGAGGAAACHRLSPSARALLLAASATAVAACGEARTTAEAPPAEADLVAVKPLSLTAQGRSLQGMQLQGAALQGRSLQGVSLQSVSLSGRRLQGSVIQGASAGSALVGRLSDGSTVDLTIAGSELDPEDPSGDITLYTVLYRSPRSGALENICPADAQGQQKAVAVAGVWDERGDRSDSRSSFTLGCTSGVIAKCVRWGYKPWKSKNGRPLEDYHQACTRMARADYCGDGVSHTLDGTWVDTIDGLGIQVRTPNSDMPFEAVWSTRGAVCVSKLRYYGLPLVMDQSGVPDSACEARVRHLALGEVPKVVLTEQGASLAGGDGCRLQPTGGQPLIANESYVNVITE